MIINSRFNTLNRRLWAAALSVLLIASAVFGWQQSTAPVASFTAIERELSANVKVETIRDVVTALSADDMQGRGSAQPGGDKAAAYLADRFAKLGLKPLGSKNSYLQPIKFREFEFLPRLGRDEHTAPERTQSASPVMIKEGRLDEWKGTEVE